MRVERCGIWLVQAKVCGGLESGILQEAGPDTASGDNAFS